MLLVLRTLINLAAENLECENVFFSYFLDLLQIRICTHRVIVKVTDTYQCC